MWSITVNAQLFINALALVNTVINSKSSNMIFHQLIFEVNGETLTMQATNYEQFLQYTLPCKSDLSARFSLPFKNLQKALGKSSGDLAFIIDDSLRIQIQCSQGMFFLNSMPPEMIPDISFDELEAKTLSLPLSGLLKAIEKAAHAMNTNESRRNLMGINIQSDGLRTLVQATDGHRLHRANLETVNEQFDLILPSIAAKPLLVLKREIDVSTIWHNALYFGIQSENCQFKTRLIEGKFPNCDVIIPTYEATQTRIHRLQLLSALKQFKTLGTEELLPISMVVTKECVSLQTHEPESSFISELAVTIPCQSNTAFGFGINVHYLMEALDILTGVYIDLVIYSMTKPILIKDGSNSFEIIMPINFPESAVLKPFNGQHAEIVYPEVTFASLVESPSGSEKVIRPKTTLTNLKKQIAGILGTPLSALDKLLQISNVVNA